MRPIPALVIVLPGTLLSAESLATTYLTVPQAQASLFPEASRFVEAKVTLSDEQRKQIKQISGVRQRTSEQLVWRAEHEGELLGWFVVDEVIGKHEFITYATALAPDGRVRGIEILVYRETYGGQIREQDWRDQFRGKDLQNPLKLGEDILNITGATLSCRNVTQGVKRLLALHQLVLADRR